MASGSELGSSFGSVIGTSSYDESDDTASSHHAKISYGVAECVGSNCESSSNDESYKSPPKRKRWKLLTQKKTKGGNTHKTNKDDTQKKTKGDDTQKAKHFLQDTQNKMCVYHIV